MTMMSYKHSSDVWYSDGTVVLESEGTAFRVYQGLLSSNSSIFADMFAVPQPINGNDMYEGVPLIHMPDAATDLEQFLHVIHDSNFQVRWIKNPTFSITASVLRLSHKYEAGHLRALTISILSSIYPSTLLEWDLSEDARSGNFGGSPIHVANLARETNVLHLLPSTLYACTQTSIESIVDSPEGLSPINQIALLQGRTRLCVLQVTKVYAYLGSLEPRSCSTKPQCMALRKSKLHALTASAEKGECFALSSRVDLNSYCETCGDEGDAAQRKSRKNIWEMLPELFGLPSWNELRIAGKTDLGDDAKTFLSKGFSNAIATIFDEID